jgi:hypothetical protein
MPTTPTVRAPARRHMRRITFTARVIGGTIPNKTIIVLTYLASAILLAYALAVAAQQVI